MAIQHEPQHQAALAPVETSPGVLVHPASDRRLAVEHWLLSTVPDVRREQAKFEWREYGVAVLPLGTLFSAVRLPAELILAVTGGRAPSAHVDELLAEFFEGGPVICDPRGRRYYVLVPASMPATWRQAAEDWRVMDVDCLGRGTYLGVPRVDAVERPAGDLASYWSVSMSSMAVLCQPLTVARVIAAAAHALGAEEGGVR